MLERKNAAGSVSSRYNHSFANCGGDKNKVPFDNNSIGEFDIVSFLRSDVATPY